MLFKKNNFFFIFFLPILGVHINTATGSMFARLINTVTCGSLAKSLAKSLVLRYQMCLNARALNQLEKSHKTQLTKILRDTEYSIMGKKASNIFWNNYYIQNELNAVSLKNKCLSKMYGSKFINKEKEQLELYNKLCAQKEHIFIKAHKQVYTQEYYNSKRSLSSKIRELNDQISVRYLQKLMD